MPVRRISAAGAALAIALVLAVFPARAGVTFPTGLEPGDQDRLAQFDAVRDRAIAQAAAGATPAERAELKGILAGDPMPIVPADIVGEWRCRITKLDGFFLPIVIYDDFDCRIFEDTAGLQLVKLTGSQRTAGTFYDVIFEPGQDRLGYAGAEAWGDEPAAPAYGENPERDQVGYLYQLEPDRLRLELPLPRQESRFDIMELVR
jgi:hypothetical protein